MRNLLLSIWPRLQCARQIAESATHSSRQAVPTVTTTTARWKMNEYTDEEWQVLRQMIIGLKVTISNDGYILRLDRQRSGERFQLPKEEPAAAVMRIRAS